MTRPGRVGWALVPVLVTLACEPRQEPRDDDSQWVRSQDGQFFRRGREPTPHPPTATPPPTLKPEDDESRMKGRYQIVHPSQAFGGMVLLDTVTGQSWKPCPRGDLPGFDLLAWCEMIRTDYAIRPTKAAKAP